MKELFLIYMMLFIACQTIKQEDIDDSTTTRMDQQSSTTNLSKVSSKGDQLWANVARK